MANTIETAIIKSVAKILKTTDKNLIKKDDFQKFEIWDSLIHLEILSILEQQIGSKINKIKNLASLTSLKKILTKIKKIK
jgi:acyl carrier protein|tara:strand:+ start:362 stop:601 length:240 start_codon:yes stop_codon:yes gene_type:complete